MTTKPGLLSPLMARLKACSTRDNGLSKKLLHETWAALKQTDLERGDQPTPSIMAALVLFDEEQFAGLMTEAELEQMLALARTALERFNERINPPNKLGKTIAATLKEQI